MFEMMDSSGNFLVVLPKTEREPFSFHVANSNDDGGSFNFTSDEEGFENLRDFIATLTIELDSRSVARRLTKIDNI